MQEHRIAGVDEAGRGPLAGPVVAAAVILNPNNPIPGLKDSKKLTEKKREALYAEIVAKSLSFAIAHAQVHEIDEVNILQASLLAMHRAIMGLSMPPSLVLIDGNQIPRNLPYPAEAIVQGDQKVAEISAASILAKVTRDREMRILDKLHPGYGFAAHKGYPTKAHRDALQRLGVSKVHRLSFSPVSELLQRV